MKVVVREVEKQGRGQGRGATAGHQGRDASMSRRHAVGHLTRLAGVAAISGLKRCPGVCECPNGRRAALRVATIHDHRSPGGQQSLGDLEPDAGGTAGDQCDVALQRTHADADSVAPGARCVELGYAGTGAQGDGWYVAVFIGVNRQRR